MINILRIACISLCLSSCSHTTIKDKTEIYDQERSDQALRQCLSNNYKQLGAYKLNSLKDVSDSTYQLYSDQQFTFEGSVALSRFVKDQTGTFHKEQIAHHSEIQKPPFNAIFARCMEFYRSDALKEFIKNTAP